MVRSGRKITLVIAAYRDTTYLARRTVIQSTGTVNAFYPDHTNTDMDVCLVKCDADVNKLQKTEKKAQKHMNTSKKHTNMLCRTSSLCILYITSFWYRFRSDQIRRNILNYL